MHLYLGAYITLQVVLKAVLIGLIEARDFTSYHRTLLIEPTDALIYSTAAQSTWMDNTSPGWECDQDKGESYLAQSSEKVSSPEACKQSCEADAQCRSITFYTSGWCSHFASACTNTRESEYALVSSRLGGARVTTTAVSKSTGALMLCAIRFPDRSICRCDCSFGRQKN